MFGADRGPGNWDVSSYRKNPQPPSQLEVKNEMDCDDARKHRIAHSITRLQPWQALLTDSYPDLPISNEPPQKVELGWGRAMCRRSVFATTFESWRGRMELRDVQYSGELIPRPTVAAPKSPPVPSPSREPPDTYQVLQDNPSPLHKKSRAEARLAQSSLPLSTVSSLSSGIKPYISSGSQVAGSLGTCTRQVELKDKQDHRSTLDVPIEPENQPRKGAIFQILQNSDSTHSDSPLSSPPYPASPATPLAPTRRRRPRKEPLPTQSAHGGRSLLSQVARRRRAGVATKVTLDTSKSTNTAQTPPLVGASQQANHEVNHAYFNHSQTPLGPESLASVFDGDLSDLEEDQVPLSGAIPDNASSRPPEAARSVRLNMMWRTVAPVKVPQQHQERLSVALRGLKRGGRGTFRTTNNDTARNAVLARAKKVEHGGISGVVSNPNVNARPHEGQNIADAEIRRTLELLTLIRSLPEK